MAKLQGNSQKATEGAILFHLPWSQQFAWFGVPEWSHLSYKWFLWSAVTVHSFWSWFSLPPLVAGLPCWSRGDLTAPELHRLTGNSEDDAVWYQHPVLLWSIPSTSGTPPRAPLLADLWAGMACHLLHLPPMYLYHVYQYELTWWTPLLTGRAFPEMLIIFSMSMAM